MSQPTQYHHHLQLLQQRYEALMVREHAESTVVYSGHPQYQFLDDNDYPFKCNPHFKHWLPLTNHPFSLLVIRPNTKPVLYLHQVADFWHSQPQLPEGEWQLHFDLVIIKHLDEAKELLASLISNALLIADNASTFEDWGFKAINSSAAIDYLHFHRAEKTEYEITQLQNANNLAALAHNKAEAAFYAGCSELEIHYTYLNAIKQREASLGYNNIVALNENNGVLHHNEYSIKTPDARHSFLIDAGVCLQGYQADITRTYAAKAGIFQSMIVSLDLAQQRFIAEIKAGDSFKTLHLKMHKMIAEILSEFRLLKGSVESIIENQYTNTFFPHGLGHFIGLQVHDVGGKLADENGQLCNPLTNHPYLRLLRPLKANHAITIEPGIYFVDQLLQEKAGNNDFNWDLINQLRPYGGLRIEDTVVVRENSIENLTRNSFEVFQSE